ncbi:sigma-70 family RNA polymerase sigma factor [Streptomyces sp. NPDC015139]|uniref:sigma-70 family RNA polymerase sigma factor n=1 Tax=Streptomyces sp. NPDC015139 TaxID=3364942 RepID=UPI0036FE8F13
MSDDNLARPAELPASHNATRRGSTPPKGKDEEFSAFYRETVRMLIGFLINQGASLADASDISQTAMASAYQRWSEINNHRSWVFTVAARALVRKIADVREDPVDEIPEPTSLTPRPDAVIEWECQHYALSVIRNLPARQRQVLAWTLSDFTPVEIAEQLGMSPEAVRASLKKARRAATARIREWEEGER